MQRAAVRTGAIKAGGMEQPAHRGRVSPVRAGAGPVGVGIGGREGVLFLAVEVLLAVRRDLVRTRPAVAVSHSLRRALSVESPRSDAHRTTPWELPRKAGRPAGRTARGTDPQNEGRGVSQSMVTAAASSGCSSSQRRANGHQGTTVRPLALGPGQGGADQPAARCPARPTPRGPPCGRGACGRPAGA